MEHYYIFLVMTYYNKFVRLTLTYRICTQDQVKLLKMNNIRKNSHNNMRFLNQRSLV
jgi:hypothetical protein